MAAKRKVYVGDLKLGMYVTELDRPWLESPFLFQGFPLKRVEEIEELRRCCRYVYVDDVQSREFERTPDLTPKVSHRFTTERVNAPEVRFEEAAPVDAEGLVADLAQAQEAYRQTREYIDRILEDVRLGRSIDPAGARQLVGSMTEHIFHNENALVWLTQLKHRDEYTSRHSINVCILSLLFGKHLGLDRHALHRLGFGALLHDIGKMRVPLAILNKQGELEAGELEELKRHPVYGYEILADQPGLPVDALDIIYSHHERFDGSGYPRGAKGEAISRFARIVAIVDVYDAITSDRVYHMGISPHEALNLMYEWSPQSFDRTLLEQFIGCLGIYPIGSIVELDSDEVGVVMSVNRAHHLRPIVALVLDRNKKAYPRRKLLNLELMERSGHLMNIRRILQSNAYGIDVRRIALDGDFVVPVLSPTT